MLPYSKRSAVSDAGKRMCKSEPYVARYRSRLIERGAIAPMGRGYVAFALPRLADYLPTYLEGVR